MNPPYYTAKSTSPVLCLTNRNQWPTSNIITYTIYDVYISLSDTSLPLIYTPRHQCARRSDVIIIDLSLLGHGQYCAQAGSVPWCWLAHAAWYWAGQNYLFGVCGLCLEQGERWRWWENCACSSIHSHLCNGIYHLGFSFQRNVYVLSKPCCNDSLTRVCWFWNSFHNQRQIYMLKLFWLI